ncbi:MAG: hypothetical protein ACI8TX_000026 [Hyphomicrobiaceae bacterium]|jgi:hypothetical protein
MVIIIVAFSAFLISIGVYGIAEPTSLVGVARKFLVWPGVWTGFTLRLIFAVALWSGADSSHTPGAFRGLAVLAFLAALALPVLGTTGLTHLVDWWASLPRELRQAWAGGALAVGAFTLWSAVLGVRNR